MVDATDKVPFQLLDNALHPTSANIQKLIDEENLPSLRKRRFLTPLLVGMPTKRALMKNSSS